MGGKRFTLANANLITVTDPSLVFNMLQMQLNIMFYFIPNLMRGTIYSWYAFPHSNVLPHTGKVSLDRINDFLREVSMLCSRIMPLILTGYRRRSYWMSSLLTQLADSQ